MEEMKMDTETQGWEWLLLPPNRCGDGAQKGTGKISPGIVSLRLMFPWLKKIGKSWEWPSGKTVNRLCLLNGT